MFSCRVKSTKKVLSLCASKDLSPSSGYLQYRFGKSGALELEFPSARDGSQSQFSYARYTRYQVSKASVNFRKEGYLYSVFDHFDGESGKPSRTRGVQIRFAGEQKKTVSLVCDGASVSHLVKLESILPCDEELSLSGCTRH